MQKKFIPVISGISIALVLLGALALKPRQSSAEADAAFSLEKMVKDLGLPYKALDGGKYLVAFAVDDEIGTTNIIVGETSIAGNDKLKMVTLTALVQEGTKAKKLSPAAMTQIVNFDYQTDIGRIGLDEQNDVWYQSSLWESTITNDTLIYDMMMAQAQTQKMTKKLKATTEED
jgi:hypothetical protein